MFLLLLLLLVAWTGADEDVEDVQLWGDGWEDDDSGEGDFAAQLRAELKKTAAK